MFAYPYEWAETVHLKVTIASSDHRLSSLCHLIIVSDDKMILTLDQTTLRRNLRQTNVETASDSFTDLFLNLN